MTNYLYVLYPPNRPTLSKIIKDYIKPGSIVVSDKWSGYDSKFIEAHTGYKHLTVNHSKEYKNWLTGACTNHIEGIQF